MKERDVLLEVQNLKQWFPAKSGFRQEKKRTPITDLKLYVKPEERTAYYVVNETFNGSVAF